MPIHLELAPLTLFTFIASITPGPNNLLLMRSGARFGVARSVPHMVGIQIGFIGLLLLSWLGVGALLLALPKLFTALRWSCFAYLFWLAWAIWRDAAPRASKKAGVSATAEATHVSHPMTWIEAAMFQLINAKAWMMTVTVLNAFNAGIRPTAMDVAVDGLICISIGIPSMLIWNIWGAAIEHVLKRPAARRAFNYTMSALVAATAVWMLFE